MAERYLERRSSARVLVRDAAAVRVVSEGVRVLDISEDGLLLGCPRLIRVGETPRVVVNLGAQRLSAIVEVRHVSSRWSQRDGGYRVGGRFVALEPAQRSLIEEMLKGRGKRS